MQTEESLSASRGDHEKAEAETGKRVLLVDDEPMILNAVKRLIKGVYPSSRIKPVSSVDDAIQTIGGGWIPDVILSDMTMPNKTGLDFYQWLRDNRSELVERIYFISAGGLNRETTKFLDQMQKEGRLIEKPWEMDVIRDRLQKILGEK